MQAWPYLVLALLEQTELIPQRWFKHGEINEGSIEVLQDEKEKWHMDNDHRFRDLNKVVCPIHTTVSNVTPFEEKMI